MYQQGRRRGSGFTLVELLLVLAIVAIATAITVPSMVRSIRGNRLRTAARTVVMAGKYARSMALLDGIPMTVMFDMESSTVTVSAGGVPPKTDDELEDEDDETADAWSPLESTYTEDETYEERQAPAGSGKPQDVVRKLDGVTLSYVIADEDERIEAGSATVVYQSNGRCTAYEVGVRDQRDRGVVVEVDALGYARTREE